MVTYTQNLCSAFNLFKSTQSSEHTHTVNTHLDQWTDILLWCPGSILGVQCLAKRSHLICGNESGRECW